MRWTPAMLAALTVAPLSAQVLPPPALPGQYDLAAKLVRAFETKDRAAYAALLADELRVSEDGREVARSKADWLDQFGPKLTAPGVAFTLSPGFSSTGRLLFIEYVNTMASWGGDVPRHCCWSHDAVAYDIAGGRVVAIRRLRGGDTRLDAHGRPPGGVK